MRASRAICQRSVPSTSAVARLRSSAESFAVCAECRRSSLLPFPAATSMRISNAARRAGETGFDLADSLGNGNSFWFKNTRCPAG